jgi:hypothetical protein
MQDNAIDGWMARAESRVAPSTVSAIKIGTRPASLQVGGSACPLAVIRRPRLWRSCQMTRCVRLPPLPEGIKRNGRDS